MKLPQDLIDKIEENSGIIEVEVKRIIRPFCEDLDQYVEQVDRSLRDSRNPLTDSELDEIVINLSTMIYFTSVGAEQMGIREDLSKSYYKEAYNNARSQLRSGTVADKNVQAELNSMEEHISSLVYSKAYKILKAKVDAAQELLASAKKVLSRRISDNELTRMSVNK